MNLTTIYLKLEVPPGAYCLEMNGGEGACPHFDNAGGHPTCGVIQGSPRDLDEIGYKKSQRCLHLTALAASHMSALPDKCQCGENSTGWTEIKCCNICGFPHPDEKLDWRLAVGKAEVDKTLKEEAEKS